MSLVGIGGFSLLFFEPALRLDRTQWRHMLLIAAAGSAVPFTLIGMTVGHQRGR